MAAQIQDGHGPDLLTTALRANQAVGHIGFTGGGAAGLGAADIHTATLPPPGGRCNRVSEILWLYISHTDMAAYIKQ